jgi:hypothetical protein
MQVFFYGMANRADGFRLLGKNFIQFPKTIDNRNEQRLFLEEVL